MLNTQIQQLAHTLDEAVQKQQPLDSLRTEVPFDLAQAYQIQEAGIDIRAARGDVRVGVKLGFTSRAKMAQMGVDHLIWGVITDSMRLEEGGEVDLSQYIHPRIEPEVCFITNRAISTPLTLAEAKAAILGVAPAMEIIDSRYNQFKFTLEDVVADNTSSAGFIIGEMRSAETDIDNCGVVMSADGETVEMGSTAAILGKPLRALVQVSELLFAKNQVLPAGAIVMAGAATAAYALKPNQHIQTDIQGLGRVSIHTVAQAASKEEA